MLRVVVGGSVGGAGREYEGGDGIRGEDGGVGGRGLGEGGVSLGERDGGAGREREGGAGRRGL